MLKSFFSRVTAFAAGILLVAGALLPAAARADIDAAFDNLLGSATTVSINEPGRYSSAARNSFVLGGADVRFPEQRAPALFSVTPFHATAGCGGISIYFGGFSFISGEEIKQLIQAVAQNSVGMAVELVMTTLCGPCAHVMQVMRSLAKDAARTSIDSCQMAAQLMESSGLVELLGPDPNKAEKNTAVCASEAQNEGEVSDYTKAMNGLCNAVESAADYIESVVEKRIAEAGVDPKSPEGQNYICNNGGSCNTVWNLLNQTKLRGLDEDNIRAKLIIMNVIGTNLYCATDENCGVAGEGLADLLGGDALVPRGGDVIFLPPQLGNIRGVEAGVAMQAVFDLFMCGTDWQTAGETFAVQRVINQYCTQPSLEKKGADPDAPEESPEPTPYDLVNQQPIWDCDPATNSGYGQCLKVVLREAGASSLAGSGYLPKVLNLLSAGVQAVRNNDQNGLPRELIELIQVSPVPLYQAINAAAVYPDAGEQLVAMMGEYTAQLLVYADLREMLRKAEAIQGDMKLKPEQLQNVYEFLGGMRATMERARLQLAQSVTMQEALMEQIRRLNLAMQREVMTEDMLGPARFSTTVNSAVQGATEGE